MVNVMIKGFRKICPYCAKIIESVSENVVNHNYSEHIRTCKNKKLNSGETKKK